jgi:hypothetical protein
LAVDEAPFVGEHRAVHESKIEAGYLPMGTPGRALKWLFFVTLLFVLSVAGSVRAEDTGELDRSELPDSPEAEQARELKRRGDQAMDQLRYGEALDLYAQAYAIQRNPALLYNQARAYQALGRYPEALEYLRAFNTLGSTDLKQRVPRLSELLDELEHQVAMLTLQVSVTGARVLLDGRVIGTTPLQPKAVNAGKVRIEILAEGYQPLMLELRLPGGASVTHEVVLKPKDERGTLTVSSPVAGARVSIDGKPVGTVPVQLQVSPGEHEVRVSAPGYREGFSSVVVPSKGDERLNISLGEEASLFESYWFWGAVGAVLIGGTIVTVAVLTEKEPSKGDIAPGTVKAPLSLSF